MHAKGWRNSVSRLTRSPMTGRILDVGGDLSSQMNTGISTDITGVVQLATCIRGVDVTVTVEFLELVADATTENDIFSCLVGELDRVRADQSHAVSLARDGASSLMGNNSDVVTTFRQEVQAANGGHTFWTFHCILRHEALCQEWITSWEWLSKLWISSELEVWVILTLALPIVCPTTPQ